MDLGQLGNHWKIDKLFRLQPLEILKFIKTASINPQYKENREDCGFEDARCELYQVT